MKMLVTGAGGFLGRYVVAAAVNRGHQVRAMVRVVSQSVPREWAAHPRVEVMQGDLRARGSFDTLVDGVDVVIHLAAVKSGDLYDQFSGTVVATENLLDAMGRFGVERLVLTSSFSVYEYLARRGWSLLDEESPLARDPAERDEYCQTKIEQERLVRDYVGRHNCRCTILRPGVIYGRDNLWTARLGCPLSERLWIRIGSLARLPLTYVENCAAAIVLAGECDPVSGVRILNVVDDQLPTQRAYMNELRQRMNSRPRVVPLPWTIIRGVARLVWLFNQVAFGGTAKIPGLLVPARLHARCKPMMFTNEKLQRALGWTPMYPWKEGLARALGNEDLLKLVPAVIPAPEYSSSGATGTGLC